MDAVLGVVVRYFHLGGLEFDFAAVETRTVQVHRVAHKLRAGLAGERLDYAGNISHGFVGEADFNPVGQASKGDAWPDASHGPPQTWIARHRQRHRPDPHVRDLSETCQRPVRDLSETRASLE